MPRPEPLSRVAHWIAVTLLTAGGAELASAQAPSASEDLQENWYKTELLIFTRQPDTAPPVDPAGGTAAQRVRGEAEFWDPAPRLAYPDDYRFLIDAQLADQRLAESEASGSAIDERGVQHLALSFPIEALERVDRPDMLLAPPPEQAPAEVAEQAPVNTPTPGSAPTDAEQPLDPNAPRDSELIELLPDPNEPLLALPYQLLDTSDLEFSAQARSLRRRGHEIAFHGAWWARLGEESPALPIVLDRSGDADFDTWPALQGSVHIYRSRYLHIAVDVWMNTMGAYLPAGWRVEPPPLSPPSVLGETPAGDPVDLWLSAQDPALVPLPSDVERPGPGSYGAAVDSRFDPLTPARQTPDAGAPPPQPLSAPEAEPKRDYPWRHAVVHRQSRRMRSGETHYLDHPLIGVIVRLTPVEDAASPRVEDRETAREFRERHTLHAPPVEVPD